MAAEECGILYTIGHSNHKIEDFVGLLKRHRITCVADIRSVPYSRRFPQFNRESLSLVLQEADIGYMYLGKELGARRVDDYTCDLNRASFEQIAKTEEFKAGIRRLIAATLEHRVALMCAEKEPLECHRSILVCRHLKEYNLCIMHILQDGSIENHIDTERRLVKMLKIEPNIFKPSNTEQDFIEQAYDLQAQKISYQPEEIKK